MPEAAIAFRPFAEQVDFFRRKINVPSARWDDLRLGDHAHGFMVAGLARQDVLDDMRDAITRAIRDGETLDDFRARFDDIVRGRWEGFTGDGSVRGRAWRTRIIYQTNLRTSYMAGRWETLRQFPALRYNHHTRLNPREQHRAWDGLIIATNDSWWRIHYPPNGWGCRCDATGVSEARLRAMGRSLDSAPSPIDGDPPPEWSYHVGEAARSLAVGSAFGSRVLQLPTAWRDIALADAQRRAGDLYRDWPALVRQVFADGAPATSVSAPVGLLRAEVAAAASAQPPVTALLAAADTAALRATARELIEDLPARLADAATSVYRAADSRALVYVYDQGGQTIGAWFGVATRRNARPSDIDANWLREVRVIGRDELATLSLISGPDRG
jgi:hypothetical protein